jgi:hypothetical protein
MLFLCIFLVANFSYGSDVFQPKNTPISTDQARTYLKVKVTDSERFEAHLLRNVERMMKCHAYYSTAPGALKNNEYVMDVPSCFEEYMRKHILNTTEVREIEHYKTV